ncbi:hypothetical protein GTZ99_04750 [Novosphingobium sp. FSY-8]|uniref:DUF3052 family protein n=1 Tax=Novosphingobium ovatum TaxID=1908523 RepID=A0ABW9XBF1_9SPHN|nr:hypothetical protein [Novosphingobium ovatum]NBC35862.1 hypothetical protein [Novosphingobium ovatum]
MSDKPLAERLQVKRERALAVVGAPAGMSIEAPAAPLEQAQVVVMFAPDRAGFAAAMADTAAGLDDGVILWLAYPKLTSPLARDLSRDILHAAVEEWGWSTVSQIALDADWSALRLRRKKSPAP